MTFRLGLTGDILRRLERLHLAARRSFPGTLHGDRLVRGVGASTEFRDHRAYAPGDDLRHLDWTLLARLDRLYVKRHHDQQDVTVHLVLDCSGSMAFGDPAKHDVARRLVAAVGWLALSGQDRVALHRLGGRIDGAAAGAAEARAGAVPRRGRGAGVRLFAALEALEAAGAVELEEALDAVARSLRRPGIVMVVSDFLSGGAARGLEQLGARRHDVHAVQILAPEETAPTLEGDLLLVDAETGAEVPVSTSPRLARAYSDDLESLGAELRAAVTRWGGTHARVSTRTELVDLLFRDLRVQGALA